MRKFRNKQLVRDATEASRHRILKKVTISVISMLMVLFIAIYISLSLYEYNGSFTVSVDLKDKGVKYSLILCEYETFDKEKAAPRIKAKTIPDITNISKKELPKDLYALQGEHSGENYFCYSFYVMNNGDAMCSYIYQMNIEEVTKGIDRGIRVRLYKEDQYVDYARPNSEGKPEEETEMFVSNDIVTRGVVDDFDVGEKDKYTVVLWIEGTDPDTKDELIGGSIKFNMEFSVE